MFTDKEVLMFAAVLSQSVTETNRKSVQLINMYERVTFNILPELKMLASHIDDYLALP